MQMQHHTWNQSHLVSLPGCNCRDWRSESVSSWLQPTVSTLGKHGGSQWGRQVKWHLLRSFYLWLLPCLSMEPAVQQTRLIDLGTLGSLAECTSNQTVIFLDVWPYVIWALNTITFLNSPCIDLDASLYITHPSGQLPCARYNKNTSNQHFSVGLNLASQNALWKGPEWLYYSVCGKGKVKRERLVWAHPARQYHIRD